MDKIRKCYEDGNTELKLLNRYIDGDVEKMLYELLSTDQLQKLDLSMCGMGFFRTERLLKSLTTNKSVKVLRLGRNLLDSKIEDSVCKLLKINTSIQEIDFTHNKIGVGISKIADELAKNSSITSLNLEGTCISLNEIISISNMLKTNTTLKKIDLGANNLGLDGTTIIVESLLVNTTLEEIDRKSVV